MFRQTLLVQWKWTRNQLLAMSVLVMVMPALSLRLGADDYFNPTPSSLINISNVSGLGLALLAIIVGIVVQDAAWRQDVMGKYVYALSMPVRWQELLARRIAVGVILLLVPAVFVWLGGGITASLLVLPDTLHAYPFGVAVRFFLASVMAFSLWSVVLRYSGEKSAVVVLILLLMSGIIPLTLSLMHWKVNPDAIFRVLTDSPSPFAAFFSRWALIDV